MKISFTNRRSFLVGSLGATLAACTAQVAPRSALVKEKADVVILGGGLAGLNAAKILSELGMSTLVLEAANRVGGRVQSADNDGENINVGASQIGRSYGRVISACQEYGLELISEDRDLLDFGTMYRGEWIKNDQWATHPLNRLDEDERSVPPFMLASHLAEKYNPLQLSSDWLDEALFEYDIGLEALLKSKGHSDQALELAALFSPGIGFDQTSMLRIWQEATRVALDKQFDPSSSVSRLQPYGFSNVEAADAGLSLISNIAGGTHLLPEAMAAALGDRVRLNKQAARIDTSNDGITVTCMDGSEISASFLVAAIPFTMLRDLTIEPGLPPAHRAAVSEMPYANTARAYVTLAEPFWEADGLPASFASDTAIEMFWGIDNHGSGKQRAMIVLTGQEASRLSTMPSDQASAFLIDQLSRIRPASKGLVKLDTFKDWGADPLQRGCGFSMAPGQVAAFGNEMIEPVGRMHFAGEHTRRSEYGMEAAMESGQRAALEIYERAQG